MSDFVQGLISGMFAGVVLGVFIMCLLSINRPEPCVTDTQCEQQEKQK